MRPKILTKSGHYFDLLKPGKSNINIEDIAHALSNICRFGGHTRYFYSVAQHSVMVSKVVPEELAMLGLLHDAAEAYIGDMVTPLKQLDPRYKEIEFGIEHEIFRHFDLPVFKYDEVKRADLILLATEERDLLPPHEDTWELTRGVEPLPDAIFCWPPAIAKRNFMKRFNELMR